MKNVEEVVCETALRLARKRQPALQAVTLEMALVGGLGLESLDIAELVATLEIATGKDPFASEVDIVSVKTVGDLCKAYAR